MHTHLCNRIHRRLPSGGDHQETVSVDTEHLAMLTLLGDMQGDINGALSWLDSRTANAATDLGASGLSGSDTDAILPRLAASDPAVISAITFDREGTVRATAPVGSKKLIGEELSGQQVVREILTYNQPLQSDLLPPRTGRICCNDRIPHYLGRAGDRGGELCFLPI